MRTAYVPLRILKISETGKETLMYKWKDNFESFRNILAFVVTVLQSLYIYLFDYTSIYLFVFGIKGIYT